MTDLAVTGHGAIKHGNAAIKAGGAGAQPGGADGLEGAFAAILDAAATGKVAVPGVVSAEGTVSAEMLAATAVKAAVAIGTPSDTFADGKDATPELLALQAALAVRGGAASGIQLRPNVKQADVPAKDKEADAGEGEGEDAPADLLATTDAKPGKKGAKTDAGLVDPTAAQAAAAVMAAPGQTPVQAADQPAPAKKELLAIGAEARGGAVMKAELVVPTNVKQAQGKPADKAEAAKPEAGKPEVAKFETVDKAQQAETALPVPAEARAAPAPAKADTQPQPAQMAAQTGNASAEDKGDSQAGTHSGGDQKSAAAETVRTVGKAANDDAVIATADPFKSIIESLPPVVQSQIGVQAAPGTEAVAQTASTGELLGNQVIDMSVSGQWIDRMAREIAKLSEGTGHSRFQLMPPNLGKIQVDVWQGEDKTNVRLLTETDEAARRLREGQSALETSARLASLSLGSVTVEKSASAQDTNRDPNAGQNPRQQAENGGNDQQQGSTQAQGQNGQGRRNTGSSNVGGFSAVMGNEPQAESEPSVRAPRADDPRTRFA